MLFSLPLLRKQRIFVTMIIATVTTTAAATLLSLVTGSLKLVMAQGQNTPAGNITETESMTTAGETGFVSTPSVRP